MRKLIFYILLVSFSGTALAAANATVDVYGTNNITGEQIAKEYHNEINATASALQHGKPLSPEALDKIITGIKSKEHFSYVGLSPILYQHDPIIHITIDVVEKNDKHRLAYFLPQPQQTITDPNHLIENWLKYEKIGFDIALKTKQFPSFKQCPAQHCLFGFEHPRLKKYSHSFDQAEKYKADLINVARNDKDDKKRGAAIYLLAHIKDHNELIKLILPSIRDNSSLVRNNAMRVLGAVISHNKTTHFPISAIVSALDYPTTTDRNKALYVIHGLVSNPEYASYIKTHASQYLLNTLKLQQPNNHDFSYQILKKISGKNYGERDYKAWEKWLA